MDVSIRDMLPSEVDDVKKLFGRSLGIVDRIVFQISFEEALSSIQKQKGGILVATYNASIVGSVSLQFQYIKGKLTGFIDALVADREFRGKGIGKSLVKEAIYWLENHGCEVIYATADRYNSPSWNIFVHNGFSVYEIPHQLRDYGLRFIHLWIKEFHFVGFGTFFLKRSLNEEKPREINESKHFLAAILAMSIVWWIQIFRSGGSLVLVPLLFSIVCISLMAHELSQKLIARRLELETTFKAWGSGLLINILLAAIGGFFPAHGSTYVKQLDYRYKSKDKMGVVFSVGPLVSLFFAFTFWSLSIFSTSSLLVASGRVGYTFNLFLVIFNLVPIKAAGGFVWDGKKILNWNKVIWIALFIGTTALIVFDYLF